MKKNNIKSNSTEIEISRRREFYNLFENSPIPKDEILISHPLKR